MEYAYGSYAAAARTEKYLTRFPEDCDDCAIAVPAAADWSVAVPTVYVRAEKRSGQGCSLRKHLCVLIRQGSCRSARQLRVGRRYERTELC